MVGTVVSSSPHGISQLFTTHSPFVSFPVLYLDQNKTVPLLLQSTARLCPPNDCPQGTSICLNLQKSFHGANEEQAANEKTNQREHFALVYKVLSQSSPDFLEHLCLLSLAEALGAAGMNKVFSLLKQLKLRGRRPAEATGSGYAMTEGVHKVL